MNKVKNSIAVLLFLFLAMESIWSASAFRNRLFTDKIRTLQLYLNDNQLDYPVMDINSDDYISVSFDYMSSNYPHLAYKVQLCNADWTPTQMDEMDYLEGINEVVIEDPVIATNTTVDYAHFYFRLSNDDLKLTRTGNYVVKVFDTENPHQLLLVGCFSIVDNKLSIMGKVDGKSIYGLNKEYQQLSFSLLFNDQFNVLSDELTVVVRQNGRHDNEVYNIKPKFVKPDELIYDDERRLAFEGGKEFNILDFSHRFRYSGKIDRISFHQPYYHVEVIPGTHEVGKEYAYDRDVNGRFKVHAQDVWSESEIDYSVVHFTYPKADPWLDGSVYVMGGFNDNWLDESNKMVYNFERQQYELAMLLKNGGYNFQYVFVPSDWNVASISRTEGSHWETENDYQIYVYYRPLTRNFESEQLVGFFVINSIQ